MRFLLCVLLLSMSLCTFGPLAANGQSIAAVARGCYLDPAYNGIGSRILPVDPQALNPPIYNINFTVESCQALSLQFGATYFGVEDGGQCFFGNCTKSLVSSISCTSACSTNPNEICGGVYAINLYENIPVVATTSTAEALGCFLDPAYLGGAPYRVLPIDPEQLTPPITNVNFNVETCQALSKLYYAQYFGVEDGGQCYFGNYTRNPVISTNCNIQCGSNPAEVCGGVYAINIYKSI